MSDISYKIEGSDLQFVEVTLQPGSSIVGEQGAMMYMDENVEVTTVLGDGTAAKFGAIGRFFKAIKRMFTGESLFSGRYKNETSAAQRIAFATPSISKILAVDLKELGGSIICQKGAYLAGEEGTEVKLALQKRLRVGFFGGEGFIMQRIEGSGLAFIGSSGALKEMILEPGEVLKVDSGCLVGLSPSAAYEIKYAGKMKTAFFGGEGLFYASVTGPGKVWLQSLPEKRLAAQLANSVAKRQGGKIGKLYLAMIIIYVIYIIATGADV
jgi:uncharacterized protein (TIGR00266 family)